MFEKIKLFRPKRSAFKLNYSSRTTMRIGQAIPSMAKIGIPGDTFRFGQVATVEMQPLIAPFKGDLWLESCAFFVSFDILKKEGELPFSNILATITDTQQSVPIPKWNLDKTDVDSNGVIKATYVNTLWDKLGFPVNLNAIDDKVTPIAYLQRAYNMINNEFIIDENLDTPISLDNNALQTVCYKKDYFSSAFTSPQKGVTPSLELTGTASAKWSNDVLGTIIGLLTNYREMRTSTGQGTYGKVSAATNLQGKVTGETSPVSFSTNATQTSGSVTAQNSDLGIKVNQALLDLLNDNELEMSNIVTFNINDLRLLNKLQIWLERNQIAGSRTKEYLLANYGIAPSDETLQRPVFLGRLRTPVMVSSNMSTAETSVAVQGNKVGNGTAQNSVLFKKWTVKEPGLFMVISFLRPKASYSQGVDREWLLDTVYDYPNPIFENLGQQPIFNAELFVSGNTATDTGIFGYQDNYVHLKTSHDIVTSELRANNSLAQWSIHREFATTPTLSSQFVHVDPSKYDYLFSVANNIHAVVTFDNVIKGIRPLHKFVHPSL